MSARTVEQLAVDGRRVLVRLDLNVPLDGGRITDDLRIRAALPTVRSIVERGGIAICMSHLGRPEGVDESLRLSPVAARMAELLERPVVAIPETIGEAAASAVAALTPGSVALLENLRFDPGEKKNDPAFAAGLAALGELYVNDAFGTAHRAHASVVGVPALLGHDDCAAGHLLAKELSAFSRVLEEHARPLVAILGGAKVSDKLAVVRNLLQRVDSILVGGAMAYTFLEARDVPVGDSRVEEDFLDECRSVLAEAPVRARVRLGRGHARRRRDPGRPHGPRHRTGDRGALRRVHRVGRHGGLERPDGRVRARSLRGRHAHRGRGRRGGRRLHRGRRRRQRGGPEGLRTRGSRGPRVHRRGRVAGTAGRQAASRPGGTGRLSPACTGHGRAAGATGVALRP
jgi:hypothetical protein